jgi:two-component system, NtrC family, response regulator PilR
MAQSTILPLEGKEFDVKILVADDDLALSRVIQLNLQDRGHEADLVHTGKACLRALRQKNYEICVLDLNMPEKTGLQVLEEWEGKPPCPVVILTAYEKVDLAVQAIKLGAYDYLTKPFDREKLLHTLELAFQNKKLVSENRRLKSRLVSEATRSFVKPQDERLKKIVHIAASSDEPVLILGETGSGKEYVARHLHERSNRNAEPFLALNCSAIPETLMESEIFGHARGAFTGAEASKAGLLEEVGEGILFLDEIGDMPPGVQVKLLRVLEEKSFRRLGENIDLQFKARVFSATHRNLEELVHQGCFREDLYYRLNTIPIELPPLRLSFAQLPDYLALFLPDYDFKDSALQYLRSKSWPGNLRELRNYCSRLSIFSEGVTLITAQQLKAMESLFGEYRPVSEFQLPQEGINIEGLIDDLLTQALERCAQNRTHAGALLGMSRQQVIHRLRKLDKKMKASEASSQNSPAPYLKA